MEELKVSEVQGLRCSRLFFCVNTDRKITKKVARKNWSFNVFLSQLDFMLFMVTIQKTLSDLLDGERRVIFPLFQH